MILLRNWTKVPHPNMLYEFNATEGIEDILKPATANKLHEFVKIIVLTQ